MNNHGWGNTPEPGDNKGGDNNRKPQNGPPDLEEVWRDFNQRLRKVMGGKGGGSSNNGGRSGGPSFPPAAVGGGAGLILGFLALLWAGSGFYMLDESERGVVLRFGRYHETTTAGLRWRLPYPFESHEVVNLSGVRTLEIGYRGNEKNKVLKEALMLTNDENIINIQFSVQYLLKDPQQYLFNNRHPDEAVMQAAETAIREVVGKSKMDYVLYEAREQIANNTQKLMQDILDRYSTGVQVRSVSMQSIQPPEQVQAAFDDANKAGQDKERQKNEGQAYANEVIPRAKGAASRLLEEANGYRQRMISVAEGDASRFKQVLAEYNKAPEVTRTRLYLETMQQVYANTSKVMVDAKGQGNLLYLPLDKLMAATAGAAVAQPAAEAAYQPAARSGAAANPLDMPVPPQVEKMPSEITNKRELSRNRGDR